MVLTSFFFFNDTATTEIYTLSLHDALPICPIERCRPCLVHENRCRPASPGYLWRRWTTAVFMEDRKSTRLNSSHTVISYAVFCLKKKKITNCHISSTRAVADVQQVMHSTTG